MERIIIPPLFSVLALIMFGHSEGMTAMLVCLSGVVFMGFASMVAQWIADFLGKIASH